MADAFDPFNIDEDAFESDDVNTSRSKVKESSFTSEFPPNPPKARSSILRKHARFSSSKPKKVDPSPKKVDESVSSLDSDIYAQLFMTPSQVMGVDKKAKGSSINAPGTTPPIPTPASYATSKHSDHEEIQIKLSLHEQMSCIYDSTPDSTPIIDIKGVINVLPSASVDGKMFYIALEDKDNHVKQITTFFQIAKEITDHPKETHPFVKKNQEQRNRVFKVELPVVDNLTSRPLNIIKYTGSDFLRPIPLLVNVKVRVAGKICRVGVKIRSNPTNDKEIRNLVVLIAVPPDVSGESMKVSLEGVTWDPMKRVIIYNCKKMESGQTVDVQLQFEYMPNSNDSKEVANLPRFPVLVRCEGRDDQLSNIRFKVGGALEQTELYSLIMERGYKVFHRKI